MQIEYRERPSRIMPSWRVIGRRLAFLRASSGDVQDGENVVLRFEEGRVVLTLSVAEKVAVRILNLVKHMKGMKDERR